MELTWRFVHGTADALEMAQQAFVMYSWYVNPSNKERPFDLSYDDIKGIEYLYGKPPYTLPTMTTGTTVTTVPGNNQTVLDLCQLKKVNQLLILNKRLYILHNEVVWKLDLESNQYKGPVLLTDWLKFLLTTFTNISTMYQRPQSEEAVLFIGENVYMFDIRSLQLVKGFSQTIASLGVPAPFKINAALHTYIGRTLVFYNDEFYGEIDECSIKSYGLYT